MYDIQAFATFFAALFLAAVGVGLVIAAFKATAR